MEFLVRGPFAIGKEKLSSGKFRLDFNDFWTSDTKLKDICDERGVYVFAAKTGRGYTPLYVGKATRIFFKEVFNATNKHKYSDAMLDYKRCKPVMFFVVPPKKRGPVNGKIIDQVETFLIQSAYKKNSDIQNIKKTRMPVWSIRGAVRNAKRGAPKDSIEFRKAIGL